MKERTQTAPQVKGSEGFSLVESLIALLIMSTGMLAIAQLMLVSFSGPTLARSKSAAAIVANDKLRFLAARYRVDPDDASLTLGAHGPEQVAIQNPSNGGTMNRFSVNYTVATVPDPRAWKVLQARMISLTVTPIGTDGNDNRKVMQNKVLNMTTIVSARVE